MNSIKKNFYTYRPYFLPDMGTLGMYDLHLMKLSMREFRAIWLSGSHADAREWTSVLTAFIFRLG
jgi:hypothetical protein